MPSGISPVRPSIERAKAYPARLNQGPSRSPLPGAFERFQSPAAAISSPDLDKPPPAQAPPTLARQRMRPLRAHCISHGLLCYRDRVFEMRRTLALDSSMAVTRRDVTPDTPALCH